MRWILAEDLFKENIGKMRETIAELGYECTLVPRSHLWVRTDITQLVPDDKQPTIFYGPIETAQLVLQTSLYPGAYCNLEMFKCSYYYPRLYKHLLNQHSTFLPFGLLKEKKQWLFDEFGIDGTIFIRPDGGNKLFTGQTLGIENYDKDISLLGNLFPEDLVLVAEPYVIHEEWRLVVGQGEVITGSLYKLNGKPKQKPKFPEEAKKIVEDSALDFRPEPCYTVDVGMTSDGPRIIEINSFSCSGLYKCDIEKIVKEVSRICIEDWKDVYE